MSLIMQLSWLCLACDSGTPLDGGLGEGNAESYILRFIHLALCSTPEVFVRKVLLSFAATKITKN